MAFVLSEEQQMLRDSARSFADERLPISQLRVTSPRFTARAMPHSVWA